MENTEETMMQSSEPFARIRAHFATFFVCFAVLVVAVQFLTGGYLTDRGNHADEAAHFVSSLAISHYFKSGHLTNPISFAKDYYAHFPKVAIGHWPPLFEILQAMAFSVFGGTGTVAIALQAVIAAAFIALPAAIAAEWVGLTGGTAVGLLLLACRTVTPMMDMVMADLLVSVLVTISALMWHSFYLKRSWASAVAFALVAAAAILTKGNAFGLVLLPLIYLALKGDLSFLFTSKCLVTGLLVGILVVPWYIFTYQMAADGFVFHWGWSYTRLALPFFARGFIQSIGLPCLVVFTMGVAASMSRRRQQSDALILPFVSTTLAMFLFSLTVPADLDTRYLLSIMPSALIVAAFGSVVLTKSLFRHPAYLWLRTATAVLILCASLPFIVQAAPIRSFNSTKIVMDILKAKSANRLVLVSGSVRAEGAVISSFAEMDTTTSYYVIRAQKALAITNWMASDYALRFTSPEEVTKWIKDTKIGWIIVDDDTSDAEFSHNQILKQAIATGLLSARLVDTSLHLHGRMSLYSLPPVDENIGITDDLKPILEPGHLGDLNK